MNSLSRPPKLVLASTSRYRRALLERYGVAFEAISPGVDETRLPNEEPIELAHRLARLKAEAVAARCPRSLVIGSDQLAACGRQVLGKPENEERCRDQLQLMSGQRVDFYTAVHVIDTEKPEHQAHLDVTTVQFRRLSNAEIQRYVARDKPFDCAGGFKVEGLGITMFERIDSQDPTALIGLPLIWLAGALRRGGVLLP
jgi:septum formation protein